MPPNLMEPLHCKSKPGSKTYNLLANKNILGHQMNWMFSILRHGELKLRSKGKSVSSFYNNPTRKITKLFVLRGYLFCFWNQVILWSPLPGPRLCVDQAGLELCVD